MKNKKLNLAEILKDWPKGTSLYCPIFGNVFLFSVSENEIVVMLQDRTIRTFNHDGQYVVNSESEFSDVECVLFPSKENRDWSTVQKYTFALNLVEILKDCPEGTKLYSTVCGECTLSSIYDDRYLWPIRVLDKFGNYIYFSKYGEFYNSQYGEYALFPSKDNRDWSTFNPPKKEHGFKPFDKVLVRDFASEWRAAIFSHYDEGDVSKHYCAASMYWDECIPYEGNEHLLGTTNKPE